MTPSQANAVGSADSHLNYSNFTRLGLIDQLEYQEFTAENATFAVDYVGADWMAQAAGSAASYLEYSSFSCGSLTDQLEYEKFTAAQAAFGAQSTGICD